ncbi:MAG: hypothetical protein ACRD2F_05205 [Terriglobales bacterium]
MSHPTDGQPAELVTAAPGRQLADGLARLGASHGSPAAYRNGCRCQACGTAHAQEIAAYRARRRRREVAARLAAEGVAGASGGPQVVTAPGYFRDHLVDTRGDRGEQGGTGSGMGWLIAGAAGLVIWLVAAARRAQSP